MGVEAIAYDHFAIAPAAAEVLTVVGWLWKDPKCRNQYAPEHANTWARMIHRNLTIPHRFVLVTDQLDADYDRLITPIPLWDDWRSVVNEEWGSTRPHCYVRLKAFSDEFGDLLGAIHESPVRPRFVSIDLDCVVLKNIDSLFDRPEDFLIYRRHLQMVPQDEINAYQGSMWMMTAGSRRKVWDEFKGRASMRAARGYLGTDQAWIRHILGPDEPGWNVNDGVYGWPVMRENPKWKQEPPPDAKIIFFYGDKKPWHFASLEKPHCDQCGHELNIKPPWQLTVNRRGASDEYQWIPRNYR